MQHRRVRKIKIPARKHVGGDTFIRSIDEWYYFEMANEKLNRLKGSFTAVTSRAKDVGTKLSANATTIFATTTAFLADKELLSWTEKLTESAATIYDKALDAEYLRTKIGGGNHRLFDGGHDLSSAWDRARDASKDDTFAQEVMGYISALWKDVTTDRGLPFATLDKASYDQWAESVAAWIPGVNKEYLCDLLTFDAMEIFSTSLGGIAVIFALPKDDEERLAEILGSMGISSIMSANPIMGIFVTAVGGYAYWKQKRKLDTAGLAKGAILTTVSGVVISVLGLPILLELVIVMVLGSLLRKHIFDKPELMAILKQNLQGAGKAMESLGQQVSSELQRVLRSTDSAGDPKAS